MQRLESYGLRGIVDEAAAARRERLAAARRRGLAEDVERLKAAKRAGKAFVPTPKAKPADAPRVDRTPPGVHRLPDGGWRVVGEAACAADLRARRARRLDDIASRRVEYATPMKRVR